MNHKNTDDILRIITSSGADVDVVINFQLYSGFEENNDYIKITAAGTTDVSLNDNARTKINSLYVKNIDGAVSNTIGIYKRFGGVDHLIFGCTLAAGEEIIYTDYRGWVVYTATGKQKVETGSGGGSVAWGDITGTLSDQTDLQSALDALQPLDSDLTAIAGLTASDDDFIQRKAGAWANRTIAQVKTDLSLTGTNSGDVTLAGTPDYITLAGQVLTLTKLDPADDLNTFASSVLAGLLTDETGTGTVVFNTSPTFTTSVLGGATMAIFNSGSTTVSAFGSATTLNIGNTVTSSQNIAIGGQVTGVQNITIGAVPAVNPTGNQTITIGGGASSAGGKLITIGINGGTGSTTEIEMGSSTTGTTFKLNLSASDATGDMLYKSNATTISRLGIGSTGNVLTVAGGVPSWSANFGTTAGVITAGTIELGHASDTTLSRSAAGQIAVEGVAVPTISSTNILSNKDIQRRVITTADDSTAVIDVDVTDQYQLTAMANATTISTTGTPKAGQKLMIRLKDNGTARALTWDAVFRAIGVTLPTTTVISKTVYIGAVYNLTDSKWDVLAVGQEA